ncbi:hypothetical protein N657DRAFT_190360 [Parathielavia appendiculata]|uniref:Uncharacterized protein n=1 Tax=Parathielavia appendiculata TaxID=2587402 RepID=A0AAN6U6T8_9PEZI|nr:hypothetical protein N657DRAFT_190360 [Parathielavia appendiculata]
MVNREGPAWAAGIPHSSSSTSLRPLATVPSNAEPLPLPCEIPRDILMSHLRSWPTGHVVSFPIHPACLALSVPDLACRRMGPLPTNQQSRHESSLQPTTRRGCLPPARLGRERKVLKCPHHPPTNHGALHVLHHAAGRLLFARAGGLVVSGLWPGGQSSIPFTGMSGCSSASEEDVLLKNSTNVPFLPPYDCETRQWPRPPVWFTTCLLLPSAARQAKQPKLPCSAMCRALL